MQHVTANRSVFFALNRGTLPGTAAQQTCRMVKELSGSPQLATSNQPSEDLTPEGTSAPFHESDLLRNIDDSVSDLLDFTVENDLRPLLRVVLLSKDDYGKTLPSGRGSVQGIGY